MPRKRLKIEKRVFRGGQFPHSPEEPVDYEYDDRGSLIDYKCYSRIISDFATILPLNTNVLHFFNKQILLFLLSFQECVGVVACKCKNPDTQEESIALYAADINGKPLGWNYATSTESDENKFVAVEWGRNLSSAQFAQTIKQDAVTKEKYVDMREFFNLVTKLVEDKPRKDEAQK